MKKRLCEIEGSTYHPALVTSLTLSEGGGSVIDAVVSAAAIVTGVALLVRELRRAGSDDVLAD